jgi:transcriptional regulator with XRE-family HTH domain
MAKLKEIRLKNFLSQAELAKKSGVSEATINRIEKGNTHKPAFKTIRDLADALGVEPAEIEF